ncbi:hypothetical protein BHE90_001578 [Fusarium euwallaceae]|uniref:Uncharacterized protein n=3 Tax=Fusarium solani species complex TaxID=232080 RepID=A0A3M2S697_9HYPO|nr:hypothetical protein CDV36_007279 [Fusarium kuroshium]RTE83827.1 hypothetical protein BHE90_001578 [Fusarium euwallaceae]
MIGTGIYTTPATVFLMTGQKALTLGLFAVGFMYSVVSMAIYLDFAKVLPYNGGELIYLDEITSVVSERVPDSITPPPAGDNPDGNPLSDLDQEGRGIPSTSNAETRSANRNNCWVWFKERVTQMCLILGDGLWAFIIYSIAFILFFNSGSNSLQFGRMILLCIDDKGNTDSSSPGDKNKEQNETSNEINRDVMRLIGVNVLTLICLLQYFSPGFGRSMNKTLAIIKLLSLFGLMIVAGTAKKASDGWRVWHPTEAEQAGNSKIGKPADLAFAKALLAVLFSFEGWENATFVAGEIPPNKHKILRRGFIAAVFTVGIFYLIIVGLFLRAITWKDISDGHENANYPPMFTGGGIRARQAWAVMAAISSFGSLNAIIYTFSRVKQVIGQAEILPWSRYLKKDDILQRTHSKPDEDEDEDERAGDAQAEEGQAGNERARGEVLNGGVIDVPQRGGSERAEDESSNETSSEPDDESSVSHRQWSEYAYENTGEAPQAVDEASPLVPSEPPKDEFWYKAPQGGLIVHWIMSVIVISASAAFPTTLEAVGLPGYIQTYVHCFFQGILGVGFYHLKSRDRALRLPSTRTGNWFKKIVRLFLAVTVPFYILLNAGILVINAVGPYKGTDGSATAFPGYGFPVIVVALLAVGTAYYVLFFGAASRLYEPVMSDNNDTTSPSSTPAATHREKGILRQENWFNWMRRADVRCEIRKNYTYDNKLERVYRFGRRWKMVYSVPEDKSYESSGQASNGVISSRTPNGVTPSQASNGVTPGRDSNGVDSDKTSDGVTTPMFLYWLFGGSRLKPDWNPGDIIADKWKGYKADFHSKAKEWKTSVGNYFKSTEEDNNSESGRRDRRG